jgi:hypothetical protein
VTQVLILLAAAGAYVLFVTVNPKRACPRCGGWGSKTRRRRPKACGRCQGTGTTFWPGARLVHKGLAAALRHLREWREGER